MIKQSISFSIPNNIDAPLWRYISIEKLKSLLEESALYFCRADLFKDPLEGTQSIPIIARRPIFFEGANDHWLYETMPMFDRRTRKCLYVNCWHNDHKESNYMWKKYSGKIAIKSTLIKIKQSILDYEREFLISPVQYIDHKKDFTSDANSFYPFFCKAKKYSNEQEVRFAFIKNYEHIGDENFETLSFEKGIFIPINFFQLIEQIIIYPSASEDEYTSIYNYLRTFNIQEKLFHSQLV
jgi:hypothetical protein